MIYEWDEEKYQSNLKKHGISFEDTFDVFNDLYALEMADDLNNDRFIRIGLNRIKGIIVVVYCERADDLIRIISARRATKLEEILYEERI